MDKYQKMRAKYIYEFIDKYVHNSEYLIEGIDIDVTKMLVSFNATHENNVDTSLLINPTYSKVNNIDVISIFKRKKTDNSRYDGNPLIYALKNINGWKFKNNKEDIINLLKQFIRISEKIKPKYDTIITVPSHNDLNTNFLYRLNKIIKCENEITNYFHKMSTDEVYDDYVDWLQIGKDYGKDAEIINNKLSTYFNDMDNTNDGYFSYKYIKDNSLRKYIKKTVYTRSGSSLKYASQINDKDILILDDTISSGYTISECVNNIKNIFTPKSITVITLFSKL